MKKTMIAAGIATMLAGITGVAAAQNVEVYGIVDTGYIKESGRDARMGSNTESRIGFRGTEDLGGGLKATFELEKRLNLNDGTARSSNGLYDRRNYDDWVHMGFGSRGDSDWAGAANVGLKGEWGAVRLGRVADLSTETYRRLDPFNHYGVGAALAYGNTLYSEELSNTVRYDSPTWSGFSFGLSYSVGEDEDYFDGLIYPYREIGNDGFNIMAKYEQGPLLLLGNWQRVVDSGESYLWNLGAAYKYGPATVSVGYQDSRFKLFSFFGVPTVKQKDWILGLNWEVGSGEIKASFNYAKYDEQKTGGIDDSVKKYALGYTYHLSKRTSLYGIMAYTDADTEDMGIHYGSQGATAEVGRESTVGWQVGMTHRF